MAKLSYDDVLRKLNERRYSLRCDELIDCLEDLGFVVEASSRGNHHTFTHPGIPDFHGSNFDCGHGKNPQLRAVYVGKVIKTIEKYGDEIGEYLGE